MSAAELAAATPATRDRYVDFLRALSITIVVVGHWLAAIVTYDDGKFGGDHALSAIPWTQWLTWLIQVMPLFFLVGGYSNAASYESHRQRGGGYGVWLRRRTARLLGPTTVFVAVWVVLALALDLVGLEQEVLELGTRVVALPLWFLAVYVAVVAAAPPMLALHERYGVGVPVALIAAAAAVDVLALGLGLSAIGWANFAFVWLVPHQLGFLWRDGRIDRRAAWLLTLGGLVLLLLLTTVGPYPRSMVGVPGEARSNNTPPTVALIVLAVTQLGVVTLLRAGVTRWLQRPRPWTTVVAANGVAMTVFLWHLTAMVVGALLLYRVVGFAQPEPGSGLWWALRPVWVAALALVLAPIVLAFARFERPGRSPDTERPAWTPLAVAGIVLACGGLAAFALRGFHVGGTPAGLPLLGVVPYAIGVVAVRRGVAVRGRAAP